MAYLQGNPNGELYIGSVKWGSDYKNVVNFSNTTNRDNFLKTHLTKVKSNVVYFNPNGIIKIDSKIQGIANYNYVFFRNDSDISSHYYCCFITNYEYTAPQTTTLYIQLDVFQTYFYGTRFYNSYIERCHIPKSDDVVGKWMAPEPISFTPDFEKNIDILDGISWKPNWLAYCLSSTPSGGGDYTYGGSGSYDSFTGIYAFSLGSGSGVETLLKRYYKGDNVTDHRSDITGVYAVPEWCLTPFVPNGIDNNGYLKENKYITVNDTMKLTNSVLPSGYKPKNNKMYSSLFRVYVLFNYNGFSVPLKPELFTKLNPTFSLSIRPINSNGFRLKINDYNQATQTNYNIPYSASTGISYNENTGLQQKLNVLSGVSSAVSSAGAIAGGVASVGAGNVAGGVASALGGASGLVNAGAQIKSAFEQRTATIGSGTDTISIKEENIKLRLADCSPQYDECVQIDEFLTMYGYQINKYGYVPNWINTRSNWNYIKTNNISLTAPSPTDYEQILKNIFNNGVTIWHDYDTYGDYSQTNN